MKLYLGSRDYKPEGFLTVDIDPTHSPDILADVTDLRSIEDGSVEEICASHILEHLPWPLAYKALAEWARVLETGGLLRVAVPDLAALAAMIAEGHNVWHATGLIFGTGRLENAFEAHQYGYTKAMMTSILRALGFGEFDWWKHDLPDASNGWMHEEDSGRMAISLNIAARKLRAPLVAPDAMLARLVERRMSPFDDVLAEMAGGLPELRELAAREDAMLTQKLHMALIDARMQVQHLRETTPARLRRGAGVILRKLLRD